MMSEALAHGSNDVLSRPPQPCQGLWSLPEFLGSPSHGISTWLAWVFSSHGGLSVLRLRFPEEFIHKAYQASSCLTLANTQMAGVSHGLVWRQCRRGSLFLSRHLGNLLPLAVCCVVERIDFRTSRSRSSLKKV
jgi:hypothetical protein